MKIAHFGTFDVENYGDLLFPLLLENRLGGGGMEFIHVSPVGGAPELKDCKPTIGFPEALAQCQSWDAIVVGGGALAHGETAGEVAKYTDAAIHTVAYPGLWFLPALISHLRGIPLVWNATGVPGDFGQERKRRLLQWACWQADYLSVRDGDSATLLAESSIDARVVPDTAVEVSRLWTDQELKAEADRLKIAGKWPQGRYLALHLREWYAKSDLTQLGEDVKRTCDSLGVAAMLMSIGGCHGDEDFARRIQERLRGYPAFVFVPDSLRSVAAAIRFSDGYVGSSLHGAITADSFGRPFLLVAPHSRTKFAGFLRQIHATNLQVPDWASAAAKVAAWGNSTPRRHQHPAEKRELTQSLDQHWAFLASALTSRKPVPAQVASRLLETLSGIPEEWFPLVPMLEQAPLFSPIFEKHRAAWAPVRRQLQNSAFVAAASYRRLDERHQKLTAQMEKLREKLVTAEDRSWKFSRDVTEHKKTIEQTHKELEQARASAAAHRSTLEKSEKEKSELKLAIAQTQQELEQARASTAAHRNMLEESEKEKSELKNKISLQAAATARDQRRIEKLRELLSKAGKLLERALTSSRWRIGSIALVRSRRFAGELDPRWRRRLLGEYKAWIEKGGDYSATYPTESASTLVSKTDGSGDETRERRPKPVPKGVVRSGKSSASGKADVIVCVHNALDDVRRCLGSIVNHRSARLNKLILVNDGSNEETTNYLRQFVAEAQVEAVLLESSQPSGYTKAANRGLAARQAEYAILLNSDTVVTPGWIDQLVACGETDPSIGFIGPISNAATWQSVPERYSNGDWAVNELPLSSLDRLSCIFSILHAPQYPRVPLVNGFCFAIKSAVIDAVGLFDEELFPNGYGEENDYCLRAGKAGFSGAIADDCYVFHAKSRSYSHETRRELGGQARLILRQKYGAEVEKATTVLKNSPELARARSAFARLVDAQPCSILFLMNFRGAGGGINSIVQQADGLRKVGAAVQVAIRSQDESYYRERFPGVAVNLFHASDSTAELLGYARHFEFVVATLFTTVRMLKTLLDQAPGVVPCYYVQDYEPNFYHPSEANYREAVESYTLIPEIRCFAYSPWVCETVAQKHGLKVHKIETGLDRDIFFPDDRPKPGTPFVVCAMVRPATERRSPGLTFEILRRIKREFGERVEIRIFGLERNDPFLERQPADFEYKVLGILHPQAVASLMRESSLFIDASTYQAFGYTGLEAMACRCATILPSQGGINEYAVDGVNTFLAAPNDAEDVLRKVRRYIGEPQLYQSVVEEGLKTAARYSIEKAGTSGLGFFESLRQQSQPAASVPPCSILCLMNLRAAGGGVNSIVQEANGLRKLGAAVQVAIRRQDETFYRERFPGVAGDLFHVFDTTAELIGYARHFEFVVATAFKTVRILKMLLDQAPSIVPCYYIQDYEPNFYHPSEVNYREAVESYTLIPEMRCFAKTRWLCETVAQKHSVHVHKVEPSMDRDIFFPDDRPKPGMPFVVCAMVRPTSERRSPALTFEILRRIKREFGERVEIRMFGLERNDPFLERQPADFEYKVLGILDRQGVAKLMRESSLFIDASTYQAFGRSGLEAMACHCATILPSQGGISEYAVDGVNTLLAAPNDAEDVLRKVRRYISEPQLYQSVVEEGLKTAARYSVEKACTSELQFFELLRRSTGAEHSAALCVAPSKSPTAVSMHRYAVVDLGTKKGGAIDAFRRFAPSYQMPVPSPAVFLGIDRDEQYRTEVTQKGYEFLAADIISSDFGWPEADHYLAWDFLEHLPSREWSKKVLIQMCRHATAGIWLRLPSFEQDSVTGEGALKKHGLRFAWSRWSGHPSHFLVEDAMQALHEGLKDAQWSHRLEQRKLIHDSNHPNVVPIGAPINTIEYDPNLGMRPQIQFMPPIVGQWELIVSIQRKKPVPQPEAPGAAHITSQCEPRGFVTHPETWMERDEIGRARPYQPTITGFLQFINDQHRYYHECPTKGIQIDVGIQGHLLREDALKLYEMAYYATGDILEFGTNCGLSTSILARAVRDAGKSSRIVTMELDKRYVERARRALSELDISRYIEFMAGDADASCQNLLDASRKFHFAFVDHSHTYDDVSKACRRLSQLLRPGSFCLFHDYNSSREGTAEYGVYAAVAHALDKNQFEFCGIYGCCGLFRRRDA